MMMRGDVRQSDEEGYSDLHWSMVYKVLFPTGYQVKDVLNDNIDVHIVTATSEVFFGTLFTALNIQELIAKQGGSYFWATDMVIVKNLEKETIKNAIDEIISDGYLNQAFPRIGILEKIYGVGLTFERLQGV